MKDKSKRLRPAVIWLGAVALVIVGVATYVLLQRLSDETLAVLATVACAGGAGGVGGGGEIMPLPYEYYQYRQRDPSPFMEMMTKASELQKRVDELEQLTDVKKAHGYIQRLQERCEMLERHLIEAEAEIVALRKERDEAKEELRIWFEALYSAGLSNET